MSSTRVPLIIAIVLSILAGVMSWTALKRKESEITKGWKLKKVLVARMDLPEGTEVTSDSLRVAEIPEKFVTDSVILPSGKRDIIGNKISINLKSGDPLMWSHIQSAIGSYKLANVVNEGFRALAVPVSNHSSVAHYIQPNDKVDILGIFQDPETNEQVSVTVLQDVIVLATGKITGSTKRHLLPKNELDYRNVTLMVLPEEAEILVLAQQLGTLHMTLRNPAEKDRLNEKGKVSVKTLMTGERTTQLEKKRVNAIEIIRGNQIR